MKWSKRILTTISAYRRGAFRSAMFVAFCVSVHVLSARLNSISRCTFTFDNRLSSDVCQHITHTIEQQAVSGSCYSEIAVTITKTFPCIDSVSLHHCAPGVLACEVTSVQPLVHVNNTHVVSTEGLLLTPDYFSPTLLHTLRTISVDHLQERMPKSFITTAHALAPTLLDRYDARWIDDKKILLQEKEAPHFSIICNAQRLPDEQLLAQYQQLRTAYINTSKKVSKTQQWSADIRFKDQIVIACQGGVTHG